MTFNLNLNTEVPTSWVKCNLNQAGFYRVNYPPSNWKQLAKMLRSTSVQVRPTSLGLILIIIMYSFLCHFSIQDRAQGPLQA